MHLLPSKLLNLWLPLALLTAAGCTPEVKPLPHLDSQRWKQDVNGCKGWRKQIWQNFKEHRQELKGRSENDLPFLLGPANQKDLLERGQKMYYYYLSDPAKCPESAQPQAVVVRVNATSIVAEVTEAETSLR